MKKSHFIPHFLIIAFPYLIFECFRLGIFQDKSIGTPIEHFYVVSIVALFAMGIAIAVGIAGYRVRNIKIGFLSLSFISLAEMFSVHGLSTPEFLLNTNHLMGAAAQLSMLLATIWLWLSSLPTDHKFISVLSKFQRSLIPIWTLMLAVFSGTGWFFPHLVHFIPLTVQPINYFITFILLGLNGITMYRYYQSYRFSRFPLQIAIVYSSGWISISQLIMIGGQPWNISWWIYHYLLLASMIVMLAGLIKQYGVKGNLAAGVRALFTNDPFERVTGSMSPSVKSLILATEKKDSYTAGHTFRVTMYALNLADELRLKPDQLRALAQGTLLHDVGKVEIPDSILNKPGKLTLGERKIIEEHPIVGYELCRELGIMKEELGIIRSHHEKWDGSGYPDQLSGKDIPMLARITAVADVYDALTSDRAYRKGWEHGKAIEFLIEQKEKHFDPVCVDAWINLCERNPEVYLYPTKKINEQTTSELISTF
ncbi:MULTISPECIES: HD-GYP domain-containing protein [unclassified Bacillus (in: firmicutes)]|uniref:HD-GYP domain-containing protein n=1 Tax=unclassified Bacillus (in: firmicutes) TaxID=185979 RepID=UPI0008F09057|nr:MULTISPECIES: HD domain-containing phosphohydrolase [unclassified Bacillus (in: firmicutes)]SFB13579.1 HDIG domain-containing protein [Bacillus sp. UNCCL13]SFQ89985.1 HDIG domain-containing protein [Bacillus sp. cl95]